MIALSIRFKNKDDKAYTMKFNKMKDGITREEATALGELIVAKNVFFTGDKELKEVESCEITETSFLI